MQVTYRKQEHTFFMCEHTDDQTKIQTFTFCPEDKCSVVCDDLKLQLPQTAHIGDEGSRDDPLRIHLLLHNTHSNKLSVRQINI